MASTNSYSRHRRNAGRRNSNEKSTSWCCYSLSPKRETVASQVGTDYSDSPPTDSDVHPQVFNKLNFHFIFLNYRDIGRVESSLADSPSTSDAKGDEEPALVVEKSPTPTPSGGGGGGGSAPVAKNEIEPDNDGEENEEEGDDDYSEEDYDYEEENKENKDAKKETPAAEEEEQEGDEPTTSPLSSPTETTQPSSPALSSEAIIVDTSRRFPPDMPFIQAIATCDTFECVRDAHRQPRKGARFNFPHFMIIGWQKSATTSLYV